MIIKAYLIGGVIIVTTICFLTSCDSKEVVKSVAKSEYIALENRFNKMQEDYNEEKLKNRELDKKNRVLQSENELLSGKLKKYKNGFKSMYE